MQHYTVTLTTQNTVYKLITLVKAVNASFVDTGASQITIQSDKSNTGNVYIGNSAVSATDYGVVLPSANANSSLNLNTGVNGTCLNNMYVTADTANSQKLHIAIFP